MVVTIRVAARTLSALAITAPPASSTARGNSKNAVFLLTLDVTFAHEGNAAT
jgi:hypothetical protein